MLKTMRNDNWRMVFTATVALALCSLASAETFDAYWGFDEPILLNATVGDTINIWWDQSGFHDVFIHPSGNCQDRTGAIPLYTPPTIGGSVSYTFVATDGSEDGKRMFFAAEVGQGIHCDGNVNQPVDVYTRKRTPNPTLFPTTNPSVPTISPPLTSLTQLPTVAPTTEPITATLESLKITLIGLSDLSEEDLADWVDITDEYLDTFYASNAATLGAAGVVSELVVRGVQKQDDPEGTPSVTIVYDQTLTYWILSAQTSPEYLASVPFLTATRRGYYRRTYLNSAPATIFLAVTETSEVLHPSPTPTPTEAPTASAEIEFGGIGASDKSLSFGGIIAISMAGLVVALIASLFATSSLPAKKFDKMNDEVSV